MAEYRFFDKCLILGAGSHKPYGFPTAQDLKEDLKRICFETSSVAHLNINDAKELNDSPTRDKLIVLEILNSVNWGPDRPPYPRAIEEKLESFLLSFCRSGVYSIDAYLGNFHNKPDGSVDKYFPTIGKVLISYLIRKYEVRVPLGKHDDDWIQFIINAYLLNKNTRESFFSNPPSIFSFNYDRFLEFNIFTHLTEQHGVSAGEAVNLVKKLNIKHIYGDLGPFEEDWDVYNLPKYIEASGRIKVMGEERDRTELNKVAHEISAAIDGSSKVYLLGYGFDEINNKLIFGSFGKSYIPDAEFFCTNYKLKNATRKKVSDTIKIPIKYLQGQGEILDIDCMTLLSEIEPFEKKKEITGGILSVPT